MRGPLRKVVGRFGYEDMLLLEPRRPRRGIAMLADIPDGFPSLTLAATRQEDRDNENDAAR
jgi:hypothetical protein